MPMTRDLRDVVNKIIIPVGQDDPTSEDIAELASDLATFFDASITLLYMGKFPPSMPPGPNQVGSPQVVAAVADSIQATGKEVLDKMAEVLIAEGVPVTSRIVMGAGNHVMKEVIEKEQADLVVLPKWETGVASRLARVISPSILEDATCPVLVLKGNRWLTKSKAARPGISSGGQAPQ